MNLLMIIRVAFRALIRNKMRAALTMLGIIIGVSAVIAMVSIGQGASASVQAQIESIGTNLLFVSAGAQNVGGVRSGTGDTGTNTLTVDDLDAIKREVPSVSMVTPNVNARSQLVAGNMNWNTSVTGVSEQYPEIRKWPVASGSFFTDADVRTAARVIVIGQTLADSLYPGADPIGQDIRVMNLPFRVVGVMARKGQDPQGRDQDDVAFAPFTTVQKKILGRDRIQIAFVSAISQDATYTAQSQITDLLRQRHKLTASEPNDFTVRNMTDVAEAANETSKTMTILLACIAGCVAARRRHRHHEHHARLRYRAHTRDRYSHGDWRAFVCGAEPVFDRVDRAQSDGRRSGNRSRRRALARDTGVSWLAHACVYDGDYRVSSLLCGGRYLFRLLSGTQSRVAGSDRSTALRIIGHGSTRMKTDVA